jgi:hypothetical protein
MDGETTVVQQYFGCLVLFFSLFNVKRYDSIKNLNTSKYVIIMPAVDFLRSFHYQKRNDWTTRKIKFQITIIFTVTILTILKTTSKQHQPFLFL